MEFAKKLKLLNEKYLIPKAALMDEMGMSRKTYLRRIKNDDFKKIHVNAIKAKWGGLF